MIQIILFIIAIGLVLYFWERFPAFKWVVVIVIGIPLLALSVALIDRYLEKEAEKKKEAIELAQSKLQTKEEIENIEKMIKIHSKNLENTNSAENKDRLEQMIQELHERKNLLEKQ